MNGIIAQEGHSTRPEETVISVSRIADAACPQKYFRNFRRNEPAPSLSQPMEGALSKFIQEQIEAVFRAAGTGANVSDAVLLQEDRVLASFEQFFVERGKLKPSFFIVKGGERIDDYRRRCSRLVENFNIHVHQALPGHVIEQLGNTFEVLWDGLCIRGQRDLVTRAPDGSHCLWMWKTGKFPRFGDAVDEMNRRLDLGSMWLGHRYPGAPAWAYMVYLAEPGKYLPQQYQARSDQSILGLFRNERKRLNSMTTYPQNRGRLCDWCEWRSACGPELQSP